ncbi:uncharacterized protein [Miscanthus floridulus]|uniref:uncharacterized protein n=1 Tax=Miscanthus floridulus TaxID=154761 RepID=UPI00345AF829
MASGTSDTQDTCKSTSCYAVFLGDNLISWSSQRQNTVSRSSTKAEYRAVANGVAEASWLCQLLLELHAPLRHATLVYCDNISAVYMTSNPIQHQRTKHIEIDLHFVRERVAIGDLRVLHVPTSSQYADIFTKGLPSSVFMEFRSSLNVQSKTEYIYARVRESARFADEVLTEDIPTIVSGISFPKSMRWNSNIVFSRPIRWILALHGGFVVPFYYAGISSGNQSCGLRNPSLANFKVETAESYLRAVEKAGILIIRRSGRKKSCMPLLYWLKVSVAISLRLIACCRRYFKPHYASYQSCGGAHPWSTLFYCCCQWCN